MILTLLFLVFAINSGEKRTEFLAKTFLFWSTGMVSACWNLVRTEFRVLQLHRPLRIFFYLLQNRRLAKKIKITKFEKKILKFRGRTETFFTQDLIFVLFCAARWCYVKSFLLMSHLKVEH